VKIKNDQLNNETIDFIKGYDVFGLKSPKRTNDNKTFKPILNETAPGLNLKYASLKYRFNSLVLDFILVITFLTILNELCKKYLISCDEISFLGILFSGFIWLLYCSVFECSKLRATDGKLILGQRVIDNQDNRLNFSKALIRRLASLVAILPLRY
jgi:hypothetical protein